MKTKIIFLTLILICANSLFSQTPTWTISGGTGSVGAEVGRGVCVDASGNVYITGSFSNTVDFDMGGGTANLTSNGSNDIYIASYTSAGAYRWAVRAGGTGPDNTSPNGAICTDGTNVYVTGAYNGAATLFGSTSLTPNGGSGTDAFVAKLNATTGAWTWAVSIGGTGNTDNGTAICLDASGNPYVLGQFNNTLSGACAGIVSGGGSELFVTKLNPASGACVWAASGGSTLNDVVVGGGICYDPITTEIVVASNFNGATATYGAFSITNSGINDMCVLELNSATGAWLGAVGCGSAATDDAIACAYDASTGNIMVTGAFAGNMTLPGGIALTNSGNNDIWVGRYSETSNAFVWGKSAGGTLADRANSIAVDGAGSVLVAGQYISATCTFGALSLTNTNSGAFDDVFVVKYAASNGTESWVTKNTNTGTQAASHGARGIAYGSSNNYWIAGVNAQGCIFGALSALNTN
ncbi:MAG: hypothetical protein IAF38_10760, partial [Bacteroidia bacterium]|nr:hypothetical protein [Bacteroidia bacterium]